MFVDGGLLLNGVVYEADEKTPRLLVNPRIKDSWAAVRVYTSTYEPRRKQAYILTHSKEAEIDGWKIPNQGLYLTKHPAVLVMAEKDQRRALMAFDLYGATPRFIWPIAVGSANNRGLPLHVGGKTAAVVRGSEILTFPLDVLDDDPLPKPLEIIPRQSLFLLPSSGTTQLSYSARGGQVPYRVTLESSPLAFKQQATSDESGTAQFTIKLADLLGPLTKAVQQTLDERVSQELGRPMPFDRQRNPDAVAEPPKTLAQVRKAELDKCRAESEIDFLQFAGRKPTGVPVFFNVQVTFTDAQGETAHLAHWLLIELPEAKVWKPQVPAKASSAAPKASPSRKKR
jgi:hypothetical protein